MKWVWIPLIAMATMVTAAQPLIEPESSDAARYQYAQQRLAERLRRAASRPSMALAGKESGAMQALAARVKALEADVRHLDEEVAQLRALVQAKSKEAIFDPPTAAMPLQQSSGGSVHVRGYYRKDGTYVRPYTRRRPSGR